MVKQKTRQSGLQFRNGRDYFLIIPHRFVQKIYFLGFAHGLDMNERCFGEKEK